MRPRALLLAASTLLPALAACAGSSTSSSSASRPEALPPAAPPPPAEGPRALPPPVAPPPATPVCTAFSKPGTIRREAIVRTVEAGLGRWLGGVEVDSVRERGRFRGWAIRRLYPGDACYKDVDLQAGDIVLRVNGRPIEKPEQANEVFSSLRAATSIVVEYVRDGKPSRAVFPIAD